MRFRNSKKLGVLGVISASILGGEFKPTEIKFNSQNVDIYGDTAVVITDCNYGLLLNGKPTTHHFAVTEVYSKSGEEWKLVTFSFIALVY